MADTDNSSNVATVAIVVLVILAGIALYLFVLRGGGDGGEAVPEGPDVELQVGGEDGG